MDVCNNFQLSLTGGFQECRNCKKEKKYHKLDFDSGTIEYIPKTNYNTQSKKEQVVPEKQMEEDILKSKACDKFELAITGAFNLCKNCKIEKKYHKLETAGQIPFQPRSSLAKTVEQTQKPKPSAVSEIVQETMMVQSVKDRIAQMNKNAQKQPEPQFRSSYKPEIKEKAPCEAEIVTEQVFTSVQDKKSVFDKPRVRKTIGEANHYIREQYQHHQQDEQIRRAESQITEEQGNQDAPQHEEQQQQPQNEQIDDQQQIVEQNVEKQESDQQIVNEQPQDNQNEQEQQQQQETEEQQQQETQEQQQQNQQQEIEQQQQQEIEQDTQQIDEKTEKVEELVQQQQEEVAQQQEQEDQY